MAFVRRYIFLQRKSVLKAVTKKTTHRRIVAVFTLFALFSVFLLGNMLRISYFLYDYYREKTYDQVTTSSVLPAKRGSIYDSNMNLLAASRTVWRVFISTRDIKLWKKETGIEYDRIIAAGLSPILSLDEDNLYNKIKNSNVLDVTVKKSVSEVEYRAVLNFIEENSLEKLVFTEASTTRFYPENTLAAHVLGFTGSDNQGLYGLEYYYDEILSGKDGYYVYAKDANGNALDTEYSDYFPAENGNSLVTTLDSYIQSELEAVIEEARVNHGAENRVTGIVMDTSTGAILGMATTSPFNPNTPFVLDEQSLQKLNASGLTPGTAEYNAYKTELMQVMWSNKAVSETYEPGSTFKILTVSSALDLGVVTLNDTFSCKGYYEVGGWKIKCHKAGGHGSGFNLGYGLQMSCNPCMIALSERIGSDNFYSYVKSFGLLEKTGIDLPSEASSIFHKEENIGPTELATASFGQRFKVSVINQLTAIAAVANGGNLVTPYVVEKIIDNDGNTVFEHETEVKRNVVSKEVAECVSQILIDGVNGNGGAKNAGVSGYDIAAKTGTSQKFDILDANGNSYLRIGSTVAYSTDADKGIAMIIVVDEPTSQVKYGSVIAAPYISKLMEKVLPYLEYQKKHDDVSVSVESYVGLTVEGAVKRLKDQKISYEVIGDGEFVIAQTPSVGEVFTYPISKVILYTTNTESDITVPTLTSLTLAEAIRLAVDSGLNIKIAGMSATSPSASDVVVEQSLPPGSAAKRGNVITIRAINTNFED